MKFLSKRSLILNFLLSLFLAVAIAPIFDYVMIGIIFISVFIVVSFIGFLCVVAKGKKEERKAEGAEGNGRGKGKAEGVSP